MRVVPVFMLQMTSISGLSIISCYCAIKSKRYSIISSFFLSSLSMNLRSSKEDIISATGSTTRSPPLIIARLLDVDDRKITGCRLPTARQVLYWFLVLHQQTMQNERNKTKRPNIRNRKEPTGWFLAID